MCIANSGTVAGCAKRFTHGRWSFLGSGSEKKWYGSNTYKPNGEWDDVAEQMLLNFSESGHPVFRGTSALVRGTLRSKEGGKLSVHFCGDPETVEVVFRTAISVNQLSFYGAVADMCEELASLISDHIASTMKPVAEEKPETMVSPTVLSTTANPFRAKGWIRGNTKIGPVLEVTVNDQRGRYGIEIRVDSLWSDGSRSAQD